MRLKQIKLAGFKSFVDPTNIPLLTPLSAIVGPNGCGKSNIIDAVRWVLGESSAKHLRGDSMTDVIFNGSSARRPVSVASVELLFDNQEGRLAGQYANYQHIVVKRQVSRDGDSNYFLNNQKCRRKDITDLFMGTGLGPRSYAIIEQGTISRLIESKPQELRVFIEEAAGISRYKERRRETENRIRHTQENLSRLGDIRAELNNQLERLAEQAKTATHYRELKQSERQCEAELVVSRYHELNQQTARLTAQIGQLEVQQASLLADKQVLERQLTELTLQLSEIDSLEHQQVEAFYLAKTHIAKLEQSQKHREQQHHGFNQRLTEVSAQISQRKAALAADETSQKALHDQRSHLAPIVAQLQTQHDHQVAQIKLVTYQHDALAEQLQTHNEHEAKAQLALSMQQNQLEHNNKALAFSRKTAHKLTERVSVLAQQLIELNASPLVSDSELLCAEIAHEQRIYDERRFELAAKQQRCDELKSELRAIEVKLADSRGRLSMVAQLLPNEKEIEQTQLWQVIDVTPGWESAVDLLLANVLNAPIITAPPSSTSMGFSVPASSDNTTHSVINSPVNLQPWLSQVHWLDNKKAALEQRKTLKPQQLFATADGYLVGTDFIVEKHAELGSIIQLKNEQAALTREVAQYQRQRSAIAEALSAQLTALNPLLDAQQQQAQQLPMQKERLAALRSQVQGLQAQIKDTKNRERQSQQEQKEVIAELEQQLRQQQLLQESQPELARTLHTHTQDKHNIAADKSATLKALNALQAEQNQTEKTLKKQQHHLQTLHTDIAVVEQKIQHQQQRLTEQLAEEQHVLQQLDDQQTDVGAQGSVSIKTQLAQALATQHTKQQALNELRQQQADVQTQFDSAQIAKKQQFAKIEDLTQTMSALKLRREGLKGQIDSQFSLISEQNIDVEQVLTALDPHKSALWRQKEIERLRSSIEQLGAINLAAITEYEQQNERKRYLDSQDEDLNSALGSLAEAIRKIDAETKSRFKTTFDKVNQDLGILFPKVFGGGSAYLALTDEDLLETGVTIMARPPGKKNSTIHLLSGGEKALTALSLVFAIFRLNPAPFCMLDEVDAPLDDANVERFCRLVKEMSQSVQFVYISHNKITMELADQLIGVTMHEPGVSRIVAVDIDEAAALAEAG